MTIVGNRALVQRLADVVFADDTAGDTQGR